MKKHRYRLQCRTFVMSPAHVPQLLWRVRDDAGWYTPWMESPRRACDHLRYGGSMY